MATYTETTHNAHPPMPTLGYLSGKSDEGDVIHNRLQNIRPDCDLHQQLADYYAVKLKQYYDDALSVAVHPFRNHEAAYKDFCPYLLKRIQVQMEMVQKTQGDGVRKVIFIPKLYRVKGKMKNKDKEEVADLSNEGTALEVLADYHGYVLSTSTHTHPRSDVVMYGAVLMPKAQEA